MGLPLAGSFLASRLDRDDYAPYRQAIEHPRTPWKMILAASHLDEGGGEQTSTISNPSPAIMLQRRNVTMMKFLLRQCASDRLPGRLTGIGEQ